MHASDSQLNTAFTTIFSTVVHLTPWFFAQGMLPVLRIFPSSGAAALRSARRTMDRIGQELLNESKNYLRGTGEKAETWHARDLLTLMVRSNMSTDIPQSQRMSDKDVVAQIPTFLGAGHETTSTSTAWALYALTQHKGVQQKLREELLSFPSECPTMEQLNEFSYLDKVVRETLRFHNPVPSTERVAAKADVLPLKSPFTDNEGILRSEIQIEKGQHVTIPIDAVNLSKQLWGEDAWEFKPERWEKLPKTVSSIPGVWGNMLTFLGGPLSCIGYRYSLLQMKALLFILVRAFEFDLAVPKEDIFGRTAVVKRPYVKTQLGAESQLPLFIKLYKDQT